LLSRHRVYIKRRHGFFFARKPNSIYDRGTVRSPRQEIKKSDRENKFRKRGDSRHISYPPLKFVYISKKLRRICKALKEIHEETIMGYDEWCLLGFGAV
jgi:hypothetical protein